jgi:hypothetical protein
MDGLKTLIINSEKRKKHILENMLYSSEVLAANILVYKKIFNFNKYKLNIHEGDTLKMDITKTFGIKRFDVVLGNPPYNIEGTKHKGQKNIYVFFDVMALNNWIKPNGYLLFIHPPVYRIPNHKIQHTKTNLNELYTNKTIVYIKMYSIDETQKLMCVMINVDFIIIQNSPNTLLSNTTIIDTKNANHEILIKPNDFIPNFGFTILAKIREKSNFNNIQLILTSEMHAQKTEGSCYKNVHGITSKGIKIIMSNKKHKYASSPKLIINGIGSYNYVYYDKIGEYGLTQSPIGIINPSANTLQLIQSPLFHYIANSTKIIGNNFNIKTSHFLPIIPETIEINNLKV